MRMGVVCGSFHKDEVNRMLDYATDEAESKKWEIAETVWVLSLIHISEPTRPY